MKSSSLLVQPWKTRREWEVITDTYFHCCVLMSTTLSFQVDCSREFLLWLFFFLSNTVELKHVKVHPMSSPRSWVAWQKSVTGCQLLSWTSAFALWCSIIHVMNAWQQLMNNHRFQLTDCEESGEQPQEETGPGAAAWAQSPIVVVYKQTNWLLIFGNRK